MGWWGGLQSHFRVQSNYSVEAVLRCVVVGVVTIPLLAERIYQLTQELTQLESNYWSM